MKQQHIEKNKIIIKNLKLNNKVKRLKQQLKDLLKL